MMKKKERFGTLKMLVKTGPQRVIAKKTKQSASCKRRKAPSQDTYQSYPHVEVPLSVMQRAEAVQENLDPRFPSFVKPMIRSNVTKGFWLTLPMLFCHLHLPSHDTAVMLEDEDYRLYNTRYLARRRGLSAGWLAFSIEHKLEEGDVLVFHMVEPNKLKVFIIRSSVLDEVDAALSLIHLEAGTKESGYGYKKIDCRVLIPWGAKKRRSAPKNTVDRVNEDVRMYHSEKLGMDLQLALNGLISRTRSISNTFEARKLDPFSNDSAMKDYEEMLWNLGKIEAQVEQVLSHVLEPEELFFYCNSYRASVEMRNRDRGTAEVDMLVLKGTVERLLSEIKDIKNNAEMCVLKL